MRLRTNPLGVGNKGAILTKEDVTIRLATQADAARITELCIQLGYKASHEDVRGRVENAIDRSDMMVSVAEQGGFVNGWIQVAIRTTIESGASAEITGLVVDESARGKGIGRTLVRAAEQWAKEAGQRSIRVRTNVVRVKTDHFYRGLGFEEVKKQTVFRKKL